METNQTIDITAEERETVLTLLQRHLPGVEAWVYGSRAKWTSRPQSDLDLVVFATPEQSHKISDLREALEESNLPFRVDLFIWDEASDRFHQEIERDHVVLTHGISDSDQRFYGKSNTTVAQLREHTEIIMGQSPPGDTCNTCGKGVPLLNGPTEFGSHHPEPVQFTTDPRRLAFPGDLLFCVRGSTTGRMNWADQKYAIGRGVAAIRDKRGRQFQPFLRGVVEFNLHDLLAQATGSTFPNVSAQQLSTLCWPAIEVSEQRAIAHILGTLDDKIELNRRMNETLETMAQTLFKSWFIDFDPVRAKMTLKHHSPLEGESNPQSGFGGGYGREHGGGSDWTVERLYPEKTLNRAKSLRYNQTDAERLLWHYLRNKQLDGYKFRRQQPVGPYIVDFACLPEKLLIELDGGQHAEQETYDEQRDQFLQSQGYRVLRFWNNEVFDNCFAVLEQIYQTLNHSPPQHHSPLEGESNPQSGFGGGNNDQAPDPDLPPPHQSSPDGSPSATPPQGGSDWTVERARAYLDRMDPEIAALFPDKLVDSELGEIPEGWEVFCLKDLAVHHTQSISPYRTNEFFAHYSIPAYDSGQIPAIDVGTDIKSNKTLIPDDAVLLSKLNPEIPRIWIPERVSRHQQICSTEFLVFTPKPLSNQSLLFSLFTETNFRNLLQSMVTGTSKSHQRVPAKDLKQQQVLSGACTIFDRFEEIANPILKLVIDNRIENRAISSLRDTLLPKLISGELRVDDKVAVEAVV